MNKLYLAWQDYDSRRWFPVGQLLAHNGSSTADAGAGADVEYEFAYINGALEAHKAAGFRPIPGFPKLEKRYRSRRLFPLFQNRVMNSSRPDRAEYLRRLGLTENTDPISELAASGGQRRTDTYQVFPPIVPGGDGRFRYRCLIHGLRHRSPDAIRRTELLAEGETLEVSPEADNPAATLAVKVATADGQHIGWIPRYLVDDLQENGAWLITDVAASVAQVNPAGPLNHRLLLDFSGRLPPGFRMEALPQYQPIARAI